MLSQQTFSDLASGRQKKYSDSWLVPIPDFGLEFVLECLARVSFTQECKCG